MFIRIHFNSQTAKSEEITDIYWRTELKCRKYTKIIGSYPVCHQLTFIAALANSFYSICIGNLDTSTWPLPFNLVVPFDTKLIWGWYLLYLLQFCISLAYITSMVSVTSYFVSCCFYIEAICTHFARQIQLAQEMVDQNEIMENSKNRQLNETELVKQIHEAVDLHVNSFE